MSKPLLPSDPPVSPSLTTDDMQVDEDGPSPITSKDEPSALGEPFHRRSSPRALSIPRQPPQLIPISPSSPSPSPPSPALSVAALPSQSPPVSPFTPASVSAHLPRAEDTSSHDDQPMETELPEPEPQDASPDDSKLSPSSPPQAVSSPPLISVNDPTPEPEPEPEPAPPLPPPKKKISMGDYLSRKREAKVASPAVMVQPLMEEHEEPEKEVKEVEVEPTADVKLDVQEPPPLESPASPDPEPMVLGETEREVESSPPPSSPPAAATSRTPEPSGLDEVKFSSPTIGGDGGVAAKRESLVDTTLANFKTDLSQDASPSPIPAINGRVNVPALQDRIWSLPLESSRVEDEVDQVVEKAEAGYVESVSLRDIAAEVSKSVRGPFVYTHVSTDAGLQAIAPPSLPRYNAHELSRQQSQEDGEIFSPPPQKAPPLAPRSHTPATHPRSFPSASSSTYRRGAPPSTSASYRPPPPAYHHTTPGNARPLPNAPRALRGVGNPSTSSSSYSLSPPSRLLGPTTPRGPSGDRNRDWDRERARERVRNNSGSSWHGR
ncbi:hypothetical protein EUX98_g7680 [Antrodiella citrinella]|uniref:Uncharacterized protein n=1 Tax=Antrodiella citrinella TaxID=2447956 RepID=A0A4V3XHS9_9APHY|nr:hypothetical protein EUX98_g7680 [Antrodiella citrinella]